MSWTDERVDILKKLWGEGRTAAEIAKELGGVTRNAVIGKAYRLQLSERPSPIKKNAKKAAAKTTKAAKPAKKVPANSNKADLKVVAKAKPEAAAVASKKPVATPANESVVSKAAQTDTLSVVAVDTISEKDKNRPRIPLVDLEPNQCRWPIGDPKDGNFGFCGCKAEPGSVYCAEHAAMAYQLVSKGRTLSAEDLEREEKKRAEKMAINGESFS